jgi:hypothetical protein
MRLFVNFSIVIIITCILQTYFGLGKLTLQITLQEPLNSEDDVSDEDPTDLFDTDNVVVCQYDKVSLIDVLFLSGIGTFHKKVVLFVMKFKSDLPSLQ